MNNDATELELVVEQNNLLREQNELLNKLINDLSSELLYKKNEPVPSQTWRDGRKVFVKDIDRDEMRDGYLVTSHRKELWNVQINLINEFARICQKHNLRWFAYAGTLLGAARHEGFIPWDDDIDIAMFRPDYEKFKLIIEDELKNQSNYHMWYWFNYRLESDSKAAQQVEPNLPLISREQANMYPGWAPLHPVIRLIDAQTTYLPFDTRENVFYGIWLDVFCLDPCPPFADEKLSVNFEIERELLLATVYPEQMKAAIMKGKDFLISRDELLEFIDLPYKRRVLQYEAFAAINFVKTPYIGEMKYHSLNDRKIVYSTEDFEEIVYLPFENIKVPAPAGYKRVLSDYFGDWQKKIITHSHARDYSVTMPYSEYYREAAKIIPGVY